MLFPASLEDALDRLQQRIRFSKAATCGARGMTEGSPTQYVSSTHFVLSEPRISSPPTLTSLGLCACYSHHPECSSSPYSHRYSSRFIWVLFKYHVIRKPFITIKKYSRLSCLLAVVVYCLSVPSRLKALWG